MDNFDKINNAIERLSQYESLNNVFHQTIDGQHIMLSVKVLDKIISLARSVLFPGYFGNSTINVKTVKYQIGTNVVELASLLTEQIIAGLCFACNDEDELENKLLSKEIKQIAKSKTADFIAVLPEIRKTLITDVESIFNGDPAADSFGEIILCYPAVRAITNYRIAHELLKLDIPIIPRIITEMAHSETGIDIHPGARIGSYFSIDHGTGVVIGATSIIGNNVHLYQGVTLGAKSFPLDKNGNPIKGISRHPIIEDNVIIYANATILGRITIGEGAIIGGNMWITQDVPKGAKVYN
jgi:serine O-acetyltransferase